MAQQPVNIGALANDHTGDNLRDAFGKLNDNDGELYEAVAELFAADVSLASRIGDEETTRASADTSIANRVSTVEGDYLSKAAGGVMAGVLAILAGAAGAPGLAVAGDFDTGVYAPAPNTLAVTVGGTEALRAAAGLVTVTGALQPEAHNTRDLGSASFAWRNIYAGTNVIAGNDLRTTSNTGTVQWGSAADVVLAREGAGILALRNSTNAQTFRAYETYTDASNYARFAVSFSGSTWAIGPEAAGTGSARSVAILSGANLTLYGGGSAQWQISGGNFLAVSDNTRDIGASGATRPRNVYVGTDVIAGGKVQASGDLIAGSTGDIQFSSRGRIRASADGDFTLLNAAATDFTRIRIGGTTSSFPAIARNGTGLSVTLADNSANSNLTAAIYYATGSVRVQSNSGLISIGSADDAAIFRDAANALAMRVGTNAQRWSVYNTYTDASNYERAAFYWTGSTLYVGTEAAGTGLGRSMRLTTAGSGSIIMRPGGTDRWNFLSDGRIYPEGDNSFDFGTSSYRIRSGYFGTSISVFSTAPSGATSAIQGYGQTWGLLGSDVITDATGKVYRIGMTHYTNAEEPVTMMVAVSVSGSSSIYIGGGTGSGNAATALNFYTAANNTTTNGTLRWQIDSSGHLLAGTDNSWNIGATSSGRPAAIYSAGVAITIAGVAVANSGAHGWSSTSSASGAPDVRLFRDAASTLALRNDANAQRFNIYNTYTDASNYERGFLQWNSNEFRIGTEAAGTGTNRSIGFYTQGSQRWVIGGTSGNLLAGADNAYDIGAVAASRPRNLYLAGTISTGGSITSGSSLVATTSVTLGAANGVNWTGRSVMRSPADGIVTLANAAETGFTMLRLGANDNTAPGLKRSGTTLQARLADDTDDAPITALYVKVKPVLVAGLPAAATAGAGARAFVTDATATTFYSVVAGGGSNAVSVTSDGTNWLIG